jgi:hypothetical protein
MPRRKRLFMRPGVDGGKPDRYGDIFLLRETDGSFDKG